MKPTVLKPWVLQDKFPLTEECKHYDDISEVPSDIQKFVVYIPYLHAPFSA